MMDARDLVARVRAYGAGAITKADRAAYRFRAHAGRRARAEPVEQLLPDSHS